MVLSSGISDATVTTVTPLTEAGPTRVEEIIFRFKITLVKQSPMNSHASRITLSEKSQGMFYFNFLKGFFLKCFACRYICATHAYLLPKDQKRMSNTLEPEFTGDCEQPCGCWEPNLGRLQRQQVLSTTEHLSSP